MDADRYDDRLVVQTNLIESYDLLSEFARKHLPDRFVLDGDVRKSARYRRAGARFQPAHPPGVHEPVSSQAHHRLRRYQDREREQGALRRSHHALRLHLMPKNPTIADVFAHIGRAEELGSGMRNLDKFSRLYSGRVATLEDGDVFRASVPVAWSVAGSGRDEISDLVASIIERDGSLAASELAKAGGVSVRTVQRWIRRLAEGGKLKASARDPHRYVLRNAGQDGEAT